MRAGAGYNMTAVAEAAAPSVTCGGTSHSGWHSPVPYLFGGLAAMLALIAFALLILACSYWKLSGYLDGAGRNGRDVDHGDGRETNGKPAAKAAIPACYVEKVVVIMAGDEKPTYIATPISSRASSFGSHSTMEDEEDEKNKKVEVRIENGNENQNKDQNQRPSENQSQEVYVYLH